MPRTCRLHLGCGRRKVEGWLNADLVDSDYDLDLAAGRLPWPSRSFDAIVAQQVIDDLEIERELLPLLREARRVLKSDGELWVSCPDLGKICRSYLEDGGKALLADRLTRFSNLDLRGLPASHFMNVILFDAGRNMNLFDAELLTSVLEMAGFDRCERVEERDLLKRFPGFPPRNDDYHSLYMKVTGYRRGSVGAS